MHARRGHGDGVTTTDTPPSVTQAEQILAAISRCLDVDLSHVAAESLVVEHVGTGVRVVWASSIVMDQEDFDALTLAGAPAS